ncbi:MAG: PD-(D/E)XK nuclease family protein [Clostridiales bacterium]|nr:PD-(D/E)XK nuclease family protein [Clostridiales bacterium]
MITVKSLDSLKCPLRPIIREEISSGKEALFIVPETSKATTERILFESLGNDGKKALKVGEDIVTAGLLKHDVLSFLKFAQRIVSNSGDDTITGFDDVMLRNVIYHIFVRHGSEFRNFSKYVNRFEYIDRLISLLGDFARFGITTDALDEVINNAPSPDDVFYDKVNDLKILIGYIQEINDRYGFSLLESDITRAGDFIDRAVSSGQIPSGRLYSYLRTLKDTKIVIYGFGTSRTFTPQELSFIKALDRLGSEIVIYTLYSGDSDKNIYYFGNKIISSLRKEGVEFKIEPRSFEGLSSGNDLGRITSSYALDEKISIDDPDGSVELFRINDTDSGLSFVCNEIIRLTREEGYRYKDIRVFSQDDAVTERFKGIMRLFGLDAFIDKRMILDSTPIMRFVDVFLELPTYDYNLDLVIRILRTGILPVTYEMVDYFENYCIRENITNKDRLFDKSRFIPAPELKRPPYQIYYNDKVIEHGGEYIWTCVVEKVLIPLRKVCDKVYVMELLSGKAEILLNYLDGLRKWVESLRDEFYDRKDTASASILVRSYKEVMILLTSFKSELNDVNVTHELFSFLLKVDMRNKVVATIPLTVDSIELVDYDSACATPCKVLFMIGCDSRNFPYSGQSEGIMSNSELLRLSSEMGGDLPDKVQTKSREEFIKSALVLNAVSEKLMIVLDRDRNYDSETFGYIRSCYFKNIEQQVAFETPVYGRAVKKRHDCTSSVIDEELVKGLTGGTLIGHVSGFEDFNYCPMRYMVKYLLGISRRNDGTRVLVNEYGTIAHSMFERAIRDMASVQTIEGLKKQRELLDDEDHLKMLSEKYYEQALDDSKMPDKDTLLYSIETGYRVRRLFIKALPKLLDYCIEENYIPVGFEKKMKDLQNRLKFTTDNNTDFLFTGVIDRIDRNPDDGSIRIVDYKTGSKNINLKYLSAGLQFQLFAYALAMRDQNEKIDNVGYIELMLGFGDKAGKKSSDFKFEGSKLGSDEISEVLEYTGKLIRNTADQISRGRCDALVNPVSEQGKNSLCNYCDLRGLCGNDLTGLKTDRACKLKDDDDIKYYKNESKKTRTQRYYIDLMKERSERRWDFPKNSN